MDAEHVAEAVEDLVENGVGLSRRGLSDGVLGSAPRGARGVRMGAHQEDASRLARLAAVICKVIRNHHESSTYE